MNNITRSIFRAIHEGRWLSIEYKNQQTQQTKYWVAIRGLNPRTRTLNVDGLHLGKLSVQALDHISIDRIQTAEVVDGSWCPVNQTLIDDIRDNPGRYAALFDNAANLRVLDYLAACNRLDATPYQSNYSLIHQIDADCFADYKEDTLELTDDQFRELVGRFQRRVEDRRQNAARPSLPTLGLNLISIDSRQRLLDKNHADRTARAKQLTALLERYERILDLRERRETIRRLLDARGQMNFQYELQAGQLPQVDRELAAYGSIDSADALALLDRNEDELLRYLYYTSARCIRRLEEPKYNDLMSIVHSPDTDKERVTQFNKYISEPENLKKLLRVFPIVATTCISAHRLGDPEPSFDMVIMDEASQCSTAMSLVPILRGASLMLVGDPQQLSPVILLDPADNRTLRRRYGVTQEYDYIENSIYKCFLACDAVSDETLLSYHYRCSPKIIEFNNRKYYNHKLHIASRETDPTPLVYVDVPNDTTDEKNTAPQEVRRIEAYLTAHPDKQVGIITPFAKQRAAIEAMLRAKHFENAACGTVHAFQGDEKDVVIFSLALTDQTRPRTYDWLKTNKELINVATSRAREQLVILSNQAALDRLHADSTDDDIYELVQYVRKNGQSEVTEKPAASRALGIKPYSTKTEDAFLENLNHALDNAFLDGSRCTVRKEVPIAQVFEDNPGCADLFYTGRFDFVVYQREGRRLMPILAIELDGREHRDDPAVRRRDRKKDQICREHGFELIRVENSYARRYNYIKSILINYFRKVS